MLVDRVEGCTRVLGAPKGWTPNTSGNCHGLPIRDELNGDVPCMVSAWEPTPAELAALNVGAKVMLRIVGTGHPPVALYVSDAPDASVDTHAERQDAEERLGPQDGQRGPKGTPTL